MTTLNARIHIPSDVSVCSLKDEAVLLNLKTGKYYGLDAVGSRLWQLLIEHGSLAAAYQTLLAEYSVTPEQLEQDLIRIVDDMARVQLVTIDET